MSRASKLRFVGCLFWLAGLAAAAQPPAPPATEPASVDQAAPVGDEAFFEGYALYEDREYTDAAARLHQYVRAHGPDDEKYEWAVFFLGISLYESGFSHAGAELLSHLVSTKPNSRIVSYSLEILEEIARTKPFDWEGVILSGLCDQEYGFVDESHADFIHYYQGLYDWERGYIEWGEEHFRHIREGTYYHYKHLYQGALYRIYEGELESAVEILEEIIDAGAADPKLKDEARVTLARILYELGRYSEADRAYRSVEMPNVAQARYLLERAWGQYRMGEPETAMGLLYAFEAPRFWRYFTPEYFILKSLIYKDVCHYTKALSVVEEFHGRYGDALRFIYDRGDLEENTEMLLVLLERRGIRTSYEFLKLLERELASAEALEDEGLVAYLRELYALQVEETRKLLRRQVQREYESLASELLRYEEEAHLIEYEIGLDMYQRVAEYRYQRTDDEPVKETEKVVVFPFQGEFWNDELDDYRVVLEDRCETAEEWDVFFK